MKFVPGQKYDFVFDLSSPPVEDASSTRFVYRCGETAATVTFTKGEDGNIKSVYQFDISEQTRLPVLYPTNKRPTLISITLDPKSIYPKYNMDFEWPPS